MAVLPSTPTLITTIELAPGSWGETNTAEVDTERWGQLTELPKRGGSRRRGRKERLKEERPKWVPAAEGWPAVERGARLNQKLNCTSGRMRYASGQAELRPPRDGAMWMARKAMIRSNGRPPDSQTQDRIGSGRAGPEYQQPRTTRATICARPEPSRTDSRARTT